MRKVTIIGAGPGNPDLLSRAVLDAIDIADVVIGAHRALAGIDVPPDVVRCELVNTADIVAALTDAASWQRAVVVMTGDVGLFSGARRLVEALSGDAQVDVRVIPGISSASYLTARLARPWQDWRFASAHGVACDIVAEAERAGELFLATSGGEDPSRLSGELVQAGFGDARVTVAERLSYPDERITCATASEIAGQTFDDLNVMLIEFAGGAGSPAGSSAASEAPAGASAPAADSAGASRVASSRWPYASSGIPDELFIRGDVPMTKQEVRAVALAKLRLTATDTVWDVGAGTGACRSRRRSSRERGRYGRSSATRPACGSSERTRMHSGAATCMRSPVSPLKRSRNCPPPTPCSSAGARASFPPSWRRRSRRTRRFACACHASPLRRSPRRARSSRVRALRGSRRARCRPPAPRL